MNDECRNRSSTSWSTGYSHSEVKPSGLEDKRRSRAGGGQVGAEDLLENLWTWPKTLMRSRAEEFLR